MIEHTLLFPFPVSLFNAETRTAFLDVGVLVAPPAHGAGCPCFLVPQGVGRWMGVLSVHACVAWGGAGVDHGVATESSEPLPRGCFLPQCSDRTYLRP